jgi:hypothetical protein
MSPHESKHLTRMKRTAQRLAISTVFGVALPVLIASPSGGRAALNRPENVSSCAAPEYHQFDFWVGDWDAFDMDKPNVVVAHNRVDRILGGCVLREDYRGTSGSEGQSFTIYDATRKVWHQTWVTDRGSLLVIEGTFQAGQMIMNGTDRTADGKERRVRGVWKVEKDGVRETAVTSLDGGKTWQPWFDMIFRPHKR